MSAIEIVMGDFAPGAVTLRRATGGRLTIRPTGLDGQFEEIPLHRAVAGCAEYSEGRVAAYLREWLARSGASLDALVADTFRHERIFVVILHDGRKFLARGTAETMAELKASVSARTSWQAGPGRRGFAGLWSRFGAAKPGGAG